MNVDTILDTLNRHGVDMLACQLALAEPVRKLDRVRTLMDSIGRT